MKAVANALLIVAAVFLFADAFCADEARPFINGFIACALTLKFFDEL